MADINLSYTGKQLDAAIAKSLSGGGGETWQSVTGSGSTDAEGDAEMTGFDFVPKIAYMAIPGMQYFFENIGGDWKVSTYEWAPFREDAVLMEYGIVSESNYFKVMFWTGEVTDYKYTLWG